MSAAWASDTAPVTEAPVSIEQALVVRAARGDQRAFQRIFDRYAGPVRRFLCDQLRDAASADEATQETFVRAHRSLGRIREGAKLQSWLFGIARNVARERIRARARESRNTPISDELGLAGNAGTPEEELLRAEAGVVLSAALAKLSPERRAALTMRLDHGLSYPDIAEAMEWNLAKVKNEIHRARLELRASLRPYLRGRN